MSDDQVVQTARLLGYKIKSMLVLNRSVGHTNATFYQTHDPEDNIIEYSWHVLDLNTLKVRESMREKYGIEV